MNTQVLPITAQNIQQAAQFIRTGELVAFPTETVYGLGANALSSAAVQKIFITKGRPSDNPLIVHIASRTQLEELVREITPVMEQLMTAFWPGPLTLVFAKSRAVPDEVTAEGDTVAIRWPSHRGAVELITASGVPIAAPSANLSGRPSPTRAEHVIEDLAGRVPLILDGGPTEIGVESSVVDVTGKEPVLLRAGGVSQEQLEEVLGTKLQTASSANTIARSPGMKYRHYAPKAQVVLFTGEPPQGDGKNRTALITLDKLPNTSFTRTIHFSGSKAKMAQGIFEQLRRLDHEGIESIYIQAVEPTGLGQAIMDRLNRAAEG